MITLVLESGRRIPVTHPIATCRPFSGDRLVKVRLYGQLARAAGRKAWELAVSSVRETINALHHLTNGNTSRYIDSTGDKVRWRVLVNGHQIDGGSPGVADELMIERDLETIDIYPVMEGAGMNWLGLIIGAILIVVGIVLFHFGVIGAFMLTEMILAGAAGILGGLLSLFSKPNQVKQPKSKANPSYLFSGTVNTQDQGGPVPVAYGNVIIGSQTISAWVRSSELYGTGASTPPSYPIIGGGPPPPSAPATPSTDPVITSLNPNTAWANYYVDVAVNGRNFTSACLIQINGSNQTTQFVSASQLNLNHWLPPMTGGASFTVLDSVSGHVSNAVAFTVRFSRSAEEAATPPPPAPRAATAVTTNWQDLGPQAFWAYCCGMTMLPGYENVPVLQEPVGQYPAGPIWAIRLESGALGVNYNMAGNFGPWQSLNDAPISLYDTDLTLAAEQFADFTVTPNQP